MCALCRETFVTWKVFRINLEPASLPKTTTSNVTHPSSPRFGTLRKKYSYYFNPLKAELISICHLLVILGAHLILHISRISVTKKLLLVPDSPVHHCKHKSVPFSDILSQLLYFLCLLVYLVTSFQLRKLFSTKLIIMPLHASHVALPTSIQY